MVQTISKNRPIVMVLPVYQSSSQEGSSQMSRVRNALKLADHWEGKSVFMGKEEAPSRSTGTLVSMPSTLTAQRRQVEENPDDESDTEIATTERPSRISRWVRRWRRRIIRTTTSVPRCTGTTRRGIPLPRPRHGQWFLPNAWRSAHGTGHPSRLPAIPAFEAPPCFVVVDYRRGAGRQACKPRAVGSPLVAASGRLCRANWTR